MRSMLVVALTVLCCTTHAQDVDPDLEELAAIRLQAQQMKASTRARVVAMGVHVYAQTHGGMPADLSTMVREGLIPPPEDEPLPESFDDEDLREHMPYAYLGLEGLNLDDVPDWPQIAIAHLNLEDALPDLAGGAVVPVAFLDGHVEMLAPEDAARIAEDSRKTMLAIRDGGPLPAHRQVKLDLQRIIQAVIAYANENGGTLPPDLGAIIHDRYLPLREGRGETPRDRAKMFLAPRARDTTFIPEDADAEWILAQSMWRYEGAGVQLDRIPAAQLTLLVHASPEAFVEAPKTGTWEMVRMLAFARANGQVDAGERAYVRSRVEGSRQTLDAIRAGGPLPVVDDAMHDLALLARAARSYARDNGQRLPATAGDVAAYLDGFWGMYQDEPARVFLTRSKETPARIHALPDADWVRRNGSYAYLGRGDVAVGDIPRERLQVLFHAPLDLGAEYPTPSGTIPVVPCVLGNWQVVLMPREGFEEHVSQSIEAMERAAK
ncbi:MAG: hypothetical protein AAFX79_13010 [Planctomycetota bacterium]